SQEILQALVTTLSRNRALQSLVKGIRNQCISKDDDSGISRTLRWRRKFTTSNYQYTLFSQHNMMDSVTAAKIKSF
ncbi:unnamed protein product, partial [Urochloa humidicola]